MPISRFFGMGTTVFAADSIWM